MRLLDLLYLFALFALSPWLVWRCVATGRYRRDLAAKLAGTVRVANPHRRPVAWFHAVSVGEVNLLGTLVPAFRKRHPDWLVVVSSTTDTGLAETRRRFADLPVIPWPFDFGWAVATALDAVNPSLVVLTESELWPNFLAAAEERGIPVAVVNARLSPRSFRRLTRAAGLARRLLFDKVAHFAVQEDDYAGRLRHLGVPAAKLTVTGSIKYDGALAARSERSASLGITLGLSLPQEGERGRGGSAEGEQGRGGEGEKNQRPRGNANGIVAGGCSSSPSLPLSPSPPLVLLAGSTHAPEESLVLDVFARLRVAFPQLHLILVPRHPDRFEEVARLVEQTGLPFVRRSRVTGPLPEMPAVVLLDTVGELGAAWGLADVGFTGGSLDGRRGGQSMIEPAGYGVPCVFGPHVWNFRDAARRLVEVGGAAMVADAAGLERELATLLADADLRERMGTAARELVRRQQGATQRTLDVLEGVIGSAQNTRAA